MLCFTFFYCRTTERPSDVHRTGGKLRRDAGRGTAGRGGQLPPPPVFGRSLNPIPTEGQIMSTILLLTPLPDFERYATFVARLLTCWGLRKVRE